MYNPYYTYKKQKKTSSRILFTFSIFFICTSIFLFVRGNISKDMSSMEGYSQQLFNSGYNDTSGLILKSSDPDSNQPIATQNPQNADTSILIDDEIKKIDCSDDVKKELQQVVNLVNKERKANGLSTLTVTYELTNAAMKRSEEIVTKFDHTRPNGKSCFTIFDELKVPEQPAGENIAAGYPNAVSVMDGWMNSEGHRANILNKGFKKIGVGLVKNNKKYSLYWTQVFAW